MIFAQGGVVYFAGKLHEHSDNYKVAWPVTFAVIAGIYLCFAAWHFFILPKPSTDVPKRIVSGNFFEEFLKTFGAFFQKPKILLLISFLLLYRFGEAQLVKMVQLFLLDSRAAGGLGLDDQLVSKLYGTCGLIAMMLGGILGGLVISRNGLKFWLWPMLLAIHLPDAVFIWLSQAQPGNLFAIGAGIAVDQFGYGFGFAAFMLYMIYIARGEHATAHYAICTGFMAAGMMIPGMWSGWLQQHLGYQHFFIWVIMATIPSFIVATKIPLDGEFGKRI